MTCMTTKKKFDVEDPVVVVLKNGRYAFRVQCPWEGKGGKTLTAFKFCSSEDYKTFEAKQNASTSGAESEHEEVEVEHEEVEAE